MRQWKPVEASKLLYHTSQSSATIFDGEQLLYFLTSQMDLGTNHIQM